MKYSKKGFPIVELLIIGAIIGIISAVAIPRYIDMQEREKFDEIYKAAASEEETLLHWIAAVQNGEPDSLYAGLREVDSNGDGHITFADNTNLQLAANGMVTRFLASKRIKNQVSPYYPSISLWFDGGAHTTQPLCDSRAQETANWGRIAVCYTPAQNEKLKMVFLSASDGSGNIIYRKILSTY